VIILFFGDSICFGQHVSPHKTWVSRISEKLSSINKKIIVINSSINGNTTRMALERMPFDVQSHDIDLILIQFGINDCNFWATDNGLPRVSRMAFEANLLEIIERSYLFGTKKIFLNTNHPTNKLISFGNFNRPHQHGNKEYNSIIRKIAYNDQEIQLIDIEKEFFQHIENGIPISELLLNDGIHLNTKGHQLYYEIAYPFFEKALMSL
jgi:acyl-CoA thioesterase I